MKPAEKRKMQIETSIRNLRHTADILEKILNPRSPSTLVRTADEMGIHVQTIIKDLNQEFGPYVKRQVLSTGEIAKIACEMRPASDRLILDILDIGNKPDKNGNIPDLPVYDRALFWKRIKNILTEREWRITRMYYGYQPNDEKQFWTQTDYNKDPILCHYAEPGPVSEEILPMSLRQIGREFNVTRSRISGILHGALTKCRRHKIILRTFCGNQMEIDEKIKKLQNRTADLAKQYKNAKLEYMDMNKICPVTEALLQAAAKAREIHMEDGWPKSLEEEPDDNDTLLKNLHAKGRMSTRTYNCLARNGIHTMEDLQSTELDKIAGFRNMGKTGILEIRNLLTDRHDSVRRCIESAGKREPGEKPEIVVMIRDGAIDTVLGNQTVLDMDPEITVVEANTENPDAPAADEDYLNFAYYEKNGYTDLPFTTDDGTPVQ